MKKYLLGSTLLALACASQTTVTKSKTQSGTNLSCKDILPGTVSTKAPKRNVTPLDIARLRDFGDIELSVGSDIPVAISPDARTVALQLMRGDPERNAYCIALVQIDLETSKAEVRDLGHEFVPAINDHEPHGAYHDGFTAHLTPRWSPDGQWLAYLKRVNGLTQLWRVPAVSGAGKRVAVVEEDILEFGWTDDSSGLVFSTMPELAVRLADIEKEGRSGFHYDDRFYPGRSKRPLPAWHIPRVYSIADVASGDIRNANPAEAAMIAPVAQRIPTDISAQAINKEGDTITIRPSAPDMINSPMRLDVALANGDNFACTLPECSKGVVATWWSERPGRVIFLRREGARNSRRVFYEWQPEGSAIRKLLATDNILMGCQKAGASFLCAYEDATQPRLLARVDLEKASIEPMFDPNPEFRNIKLGQVERYAFKNEFAQESYVDLVLPPDYKPGRKLPLVVVGYVSRGFLRGGVGDEYPIHAFAARGFAVLSYERPFQLTWDQPAADVDALVRRFSKDWIDRRSVTSTLEMAIKHFAARGLIDTDHIGITGFSDGVSTAHWALLNTGLFSAAALSQCCDDQIPISTIYGPWTYRRIGRWGYPSVRATDAPLWKDVSYAQNAETFKTPLLLQISDNEYQASLQSYAALTPHDRPFDLFVFPNEYHVKWQPAHRLAIYNRSLDWFDFWLRGVESRDPARKDDLARWRNWRNK